jgi:hypothetical protein
MLSYTAKQTTYNTHSTFKNIHMQYLIGNPHPYSTKGIKDITEVLGDQQAEGIKLTVDLLVEQVAAIRVQEHLTVDFLVELF